MTDDTPAPAPTVERRPRTPKPTGTLDVVVMRDVWDENVVRHRVGTVRTVPLEEALDGIEDGRYARHKG
jgi:hypothetical protein